MTVEPGDSSNQASPGPSGWPPVPREHGLSFRERPVLPPDPRVLPPPPPPPDPRQFGNWQQPQQPIQMQRTNGLATAGFVLSLVWLCGLGSILGVLFGIIGLSQINASGGTQTGKGLAWAAIILGGGALLLMMMVSAAADSSNGGY